MCYANQLTGFYMRATLAFNGLKEKSGHIGKKSVETLKILCSKIFEKLPPGLWTCKNLDSHLPKKIVLFASLIAL